MARGDIIVINQSGRGDKDIFTVADAFDDPEWQRIYHSKSGGLSCLKPTSPNGWQKRDILLMTHIVLGYPSYEASLDIVAAMVDAGVDLMELQIPFSEPIADGPVILHANQRALASGTERAQMP